MTKDEKFDDDEVVSKFVDLINEHATDSDINDFREKYRSNANLSALLNEALMVAKECARERRRAEKMPN